MIGNANDKDLLKRLYYQQQASQPVTLTQTQQNNSKVGVPLEKTLGRSDYGGSHWDQMYFTDDELLNSYNTRNAADRGEITWDDAHKYVENIRKKYGYSGGKHGDEYNLLSQPVRTDSWENTVSDVMQNMANYDQLLSSDPYQPGLDAAYQAILDRKPFEYDLEADPAWQAYRKQYTREGRRASEDTLGQYAAMTGGMPSTAAMTAAQQAGDYYAAQMSDKIPELYRLAYSMYSDDANRQLADLNAIRSLSGDWYGRQTDAYGRLGDLYSMASGERSYADSRAQQEYERMYNEAWDAYLKAGDDTLLRSLGVQPNSDNLLAYALATNGRNVPIGSGSSGGSSGAYTGVFSEGEDRGKWAAVEDWVSLYGEDAADDYIKEHYKELGYKTQSAALAGWNNHLLESGFSAGEKEYEPSVDSVKNNGKKDSHDVMHGIADDLGLDSVAGTGWGVNETANGFAMSPAAQRIMNTIASFSYGATPADAQAYAADAIEDAYNKGEISPEEAQYLLSLFGY